MIAAPEFLCCGAIALTTLLASGADPLGIDAREVRFPAWLPLAALALLAACSALFGVRDPETLAVVFGAL
jgi:hypothetical protein